MKKHFLNNSFMLFRFFLIALIGVISFACSSTSDKHKFTRTVEKPMDLDGVAIDSTFGITPQNSVNVGGLNNGEGVINERRYLNAIAGPNGELIKYYRKGSCCPIKSSKALFGDHVLLDEYIVKWKGLDSSISIYINMYDSGELKAPVGFTVRKLY